VIVKMVLVLLPSKYIGGAEMRALDISRQIADSADSSVVAFYPYEGVEGLREKFENIGFKYEKAFVGDYGYKGWFGLKEKSAILLSLLSTLRLLSKYKPESVFLTMPWPYASIGSIVACALLRTRIVVRFALVPECLPQNSLRVRLLRWAKGRSQYWVALSSNNEELLAKHFAIAKSDIALVYNGFCGQKSEHVTLAPKSSLREELNLPLDSKILLTVGALAYRKGHDLLIPILPALIERYPNVYFMWVGSGALEQRYRDLLKEQKIDGRVLIVGQRNDIPRILKESDLFVFPSRFEGCPSALLEAIRYELPAIVSNLSSMPEIIEHNVTGLLADIDSVQDFEEKISFAIEHPDDMRCYAKEATKMLDVFSVEKMMKAYLGLLNVKSP